MIAVKNDNITINSQEIKENTKASEKYVDVTFNFPERNEIWNGWIPIYYRRTGVELRTEEEISEHIEAIYKVMSELSLEDWRKTEQEYWDTERKKSKTTRPFFDKLSEGGWKCRQHELPQNPNCARRIQDIKEFGYTIATDLNRYCDQCGEKTTHLMIVPIPRVQIAGNGYETWSPALRKRILKVLGNYDVFEAKKGTHLLPDHKFSEIRWDEHTKSENPDDMKDDEIISKFQLLSNQRNQQKREACRTCFQTGKRQYPFGIKYFYSGDENWDPSIPLKGKEAEKGCFGCGWYDIEEWRKSIISVLNTNEE